MTSDSLETAQYHFSTGKPFLTAVKIAVCCIYMYVIVMYFWTHRKESVVCKIVQKGDWSGYVEYKSVPMLSSKNKDTKVLDVKTVTHNSQKRKLVLLEDGTVYKIKKSKLEDHVSPGLILP